jgi:YidC/Oxa1 family membrane protein insertase
MFTFKNLRTVLWAGLGVALLANYSTWMRDYAAKDAAAAATIKAAEVAHPPAALSDAIPQAVVPSEPAANTGAVNADVPNAGTDVPVVAASPAIGAPATPADTSPGVITVHTDVLDLDINLRGGDLERADLLAYPLVKNQPAPVRLLRRHGAGDTYLLQTGLTSGNPAAGGEFPTHLASSLSVIVSLRYFLPSYRAGPVKA